MLNKTFLISLLPLIVRAQYSAWYTPEDLPNHTEQGQIGTNICGTTGDQNSMCQTMYVNSINDFCLWAPPVSGGTVGNDEREMVAYCTTGAHGTRVIPAGTFRGVHFVQTPNYVQVTGVGDFTQIGIKAGDSGGELDPHGADGNGNPIGGIVFSTAFGNGVQQIHEWTNYMAANEFCIRACNPADQYAWLYCNHVYDLMGCDWNMPGNYNGGVFETCLGESDTPMGIYSANGQGWGSTWSQGIKPTPPPSPAAPSSMCVTIPNLAQSVAPLTLIANSSSMSASSSSVIMSNSSTSTSMPMPTSTSTVVINAVPTNGGPLFSTSTVSITSSNTFSGAPASLVTRALGFGLASTFALLGITLFLF